MASRTAGIRKILGTWRTRLLVGVPTVAGAYQFCCDQFDFPTLPKLWGMTTALVPWWGWLLIAQAGFVYALFEYVRRMGNFESPVLTETDPESVAHLISLDQGLAGQRERLEALEARPGPPEEHGVTSRFAIEQARASLHGQMVEQYQAKLDHLEAIEDKSSMHHPKGDGLRHQETPDRLVLLGLDRDKSLQLLGTARASVMGDAARIANRDWHLKKAETQTILRLLNDVSLPRVEPERLLRTLKDIEDSHARKQQG